MLLLLLGVRLPSGDLGTVLRRWRLWLGCWRTTAITLSPPIWRTGDTAEGGRDFMLETRLPDGVTAIVTNPPYDNLFEFVVHALKLTQPDGGHGGAAGELPVGRPVRRPATYVSIPAFDTTVALADRIDWSSGIGVPATNRGNHNHCWLVWDWSRAARSRPEFVTSATRKNHGGPAVGLGRLDDAPEWAR